MEIESAPSTQSPCQAVQSSTAGVTLQQWNDFFSSIEVGNESSEKHESSLGCLTHTTDSPDSVN